MRFGTISGINQPVSRLIQGTATVLSEGLLDLAFEYGFNTFDTAHVYGKDSSVLFGQWLRDRNVRDQVNILAKGAHPYDGRHRVTPEDIVSDLHDTFAWMQVDHVEMLVLHRDDPAVPVGPLVEALNELHQAGKIGAFGGSNWSYARIREANEYAAAHGLIPFAVSSPNYSLAEQVKEPWDDCLTISGPQGETARHDYAASDLAVLAWSSLAGGFFSDRFHRDNLAQFSQDDYFAQLCLKCYCYEPNFRRLDRARDLARQKDLAVPQVALAFVLNQPMNLYALVSCADRAQFVANTAALDLKLTPNELAYLDLKADAPE